MQNKIIYDQITSGEGYAIFKVDNLNYIEEIRKNLLFKFNKEDEINDFNEFRLTLGMMSNKDVNNLMVKLLGFNEASTLMLNACKDIVKNLCTDKIFLQRRANIIFNLPGEDQRHQWPHYEMMSGISPYTFVLWAPLHDIEDESGLFYLNSKESLVYMKKEIENGLVNSPYIFENLKNRKPVKVNYGEVIVFNPFILHGNVPFNGEKARIACSIRVQSSEKALMQRNTDFFKYFLIK